LGSKGLNAANRKDDHLLPASSTSAIEEAGKTKGPKTTTDETPPAGSQNSPKEVMAPLGPNPFAQRLGDLFEGSISPIPDEDVKIKRILRTPFFKDLVGEGTQVPFAKTQLTNGGPVEVSRSLQARGA
jgi:hypothetical protein